MAMTRYVALLRGINVGGNNLIKMAALRSCLEEAGFLDVATYIASGNVLFTPAKPAPAAALTRTLETLLASTFRYEASLVLRDRKQMAQVVDKAPSGFGTKPDKYRYDVIFLKDTLAAADALKQLPLKDGVDEGWAGPGVLYTSRLVAKVTQSRLSKVASLPVYRSMTIRNWNTTTKLVKLLEG